MPHPRRMDGWFVCGDCVYIWCARAMDSLARLPHTIRHLKRAIKRELAVTSHSIGRAVRPIYCVSELRHHTSGIIPARYQTLASVLLLRDINFVQRTRQAARWPLLPHDASSAEMPLGGEKISLCIREGKNCDPGIRRKFLLAFKPWSSFWRLQEIYTICVLKKHNIWQYWWNDIKITALLTVINAYMKMLRGEKTKYLDSV